MSISGVNKIKSHRDSIVICFLDSKERVSHVEKIEEKRRPAQPFGEGKAKDDQSSGECSRQRSGVLSV